MTKVPHLGRWYPTLERVIFPWPVNQLRVALVRGPIILRQISTSCLWTRIDRTGQREGSLLCYCTTSQLFLLLTIGFMTLGVWHEPDSGIARGGGENVSISLKQVLKLRNGTLFLFQSVGYPHINSCILFFKFTCSCSYNKAWAPCEWI